MRSWSMIVWLGAVITDQLWTSLPRSMGRWFYSCHTATPPTNKNILLQNKLGSVRLAGKIGQLFKISRVNGCVKGGRGVGIIKWKKKWKVLNVFTIIQSVHDWSTIVDLKWSNFDPVKLDLQQGRSQKKSYDCPWLNSPPSYLAQGFAFTLQKKSKWKKMIHTGYSPLL